MKKILSLVFCVISSIMFFMLAFNVNLTQTNAENLTSSIFTENDIKNKEDIISVDKNIFGGAVATVGNSPFDEETDTLMDGYTITPNSDAYNQVDWSVGVSGFTLSFSQSVYMWVYLPCDPDYNLYTLKLTITDISKNLKLTWEYEHSQLVDMISKIAIGDKNYGWVLFELNPATTGVSSEELVDANFTRLGISYNSEIPELAIKVNNNALSFYHVYKGDSVKNSSVIIIKQKYAIYKFAESYLGNKIAHIGDTYKFDFKNIFEYIYIGKYDMYKYSIEGYTWNISLKDSYSKVIDLNANQEYVFERVGWYSVNITLKERNHIISNDENQGLNIDKFIFSVSSSIKCEEYSLGTFGNPKYTIPTNNEYIVTFKFYDGFKIYGDFVISTSDEKVAVIDSYSFDEDTKTIYIKINTKKSGNIQLNIEANGFMDDKNKLSEYSRSCNLVVKGENASTKLSTIFLWVILGIYGVALVVFVVISVVKSRQNSVK